MGGEGGKVRRGRESEETVVHLKSFHKPRLFPNLTNVPPPSSPDWMAYVTASFSSSSVALTLITDTPDVMF